MSHPIISDQEAHDEAEDLLPWYVTGQLEEGDRTRVEEHLSSCSRCREQLTFERRMVQEFRAQAPEVDSGWARIRDRIEQRQNAPSPVRRAANDLWNVFRQPGVMALAAAQIGFLVVGGSILVSLSQPTYRALGSAPTSPTANLIVIFRADATEEDIRDALKANNASIVGGPTSADAYLLRVPARQRQLALARLQSNEEVQMAEPIDGAVQ
jgi:anti-sigma-K factor RskA